jgi:hypothetical protein
MAGNEAEPAIPGIHSRARDAGVVTGVAEDISEGDVDQSEVGRRATEDLSLPVVTCRHPSLPVVTRR